MSCETPSSFRGHVYVSVYTIGRVCAYSLGEKLFTEQNLPFSSVFVQGAQPGGPSTSPLTKHSFAFQQGRGVTPTPALSTVLQGVTCLCGCSRWPLARLRAEPPGSCAGDQEGEHLWVQNNQEQTNRSPGERTVLSKVLCKASLFLFIYIQNDRGQRLEEGNVVRQWLETNNSLH